VAGDQSGGGRPSTYEQSHFSISNAVGGGGSFVKQVGDTSDKILVTERITLLLQGEDTDRNSKSKSNNDSKISDDLVISAPVKSLQTVHVRYNFDLNMFEGLPKEWRDLLELPPQYDEVDSIDSSLKIKKDRLKFPESSRNHITIYEVRQKMNEDGTQASFIITAT